MPELEVAVVVPGTPERAFDAWTRPTELAAWWGPPSCRRVEATVDLRVGGLYSIDHEFDDGSRAIIEGEFIEVVRPERLVYSWGTNGAAPSEEIVEVLFTAVPAGTEVIVRHARIADAEARHGHLTGWEACLAGLGRYLVEDTKG